MALSDRIPTFQSGDRTIEFVDPPTRGIIGNIVLLTGFIGIVFMILISIGFLDQETWHWLPLGVFLALMTANPIITLPRFWEAVTVIEMYAIFISYLIIYHMDKITNALILSTVLLFLIIIFEFPRRFNIK